MTSVGFIGLGNLGGAMAEKLVEHGHDPLVFDIDDDALDTLVAAGATAADSAADLAARSDVVMLCLPSHTIVEQIVLGENGIADALSPGDILVDTTTSEPETTQRIQERLDEDGIDFLGAPVSGGRPGARQQALTVMVGGDGDLLETVRPLLDAFAGNIYHVGDQPHHGHAMKLINNYLSYVNMIATTEATLAGEALGLDLETMLAVINDSSGRNSWSEEKFPEEVVTGEFDRGSSLNIAEKDVELGRAVVSKHGPDLELADVVLAAIRQSKDELGGETDLTRVYEFYK
ncbi:MULTISPECIES: NAD(P)-dependent oxidoreductase [Salinibaculum]|uniref:NAD(P)-dependent oxidoreductase n=1 Tax=Salinibaculum TaxID=2732368 RepID=UPI0030CE76E7